MTGIDAFRHTIVSLVRQDVPDLSARQMGVFLNVYLNEEPQTVRGLASELNISKPAITRALDRLGELELVRRTVDPQDRRSVLVVRTTQGTSYLDNIEKIIASAEMAPAKAA